MMTSLSYKGKVIKRKKLSSGILFTIQDTTNQSYGCYLSKIISNYSSLLKLTHFGLFIIVETDIDNIKIFENESLNIINIELIEDKSTKYTNQSIFNLNNLCALFRKRCVISMDLSLKQMEIPYKCIENKCKYRHKLFEYDIKSIMRSIKQRKISLSKQFDINDPFNDKNKKSSKYRRASQFTDWIINDNNFGLILKKNKSMILDIAGGSGDMACYLTIKGYKVIVIDPFKPQKMPKWQIKKLENYFKSKEKYPYYQHIKELFNDEFIINHIDLIKKCDLMIGMHPDQATECIVKYANIFNKNMAVVPCCVFAQQFTNRIYTNNNREIQKVTTYCQFIQYLLQINTNLKSDYLPFRGKNKILFEKSKNMDLTCRKSSHCQII